MCRVRDQRRDAALEVVWPRRRRCSKSSAKKIPITPEAAWSRARSGMPWNFVAPAREVGLRLAAEGPSDYLCLLGPRRAERTQFRGPNAAGIAEGYPPLAAGATQTPRPSSGEQRSPDSGIRLPSSGLPACLRRRRQETRRSITAARALRRCRSGGRRRGSGMAAVQFRRTTGRVIWSQTGTYMTGHWPPDPGGSKERVKRE